MSNNTILNITPIWGWVVAILWVFTKKRATIMTTQGQFKMVEIFGKNLVSKGIN